MARGSNFCHTPDIETEPVRPKGIKFGRILLWLVNLHSAKTLGHVTVQNS